jgi:hypothetical protein
MVLTLNAELGDWIWRNVTAQPRLPMGFEKIEAGGEIRMVIF